MKTFKVTIVQFLNPNSVAEIVQIQANNYREAMRTAVKSREGYISIEAEEI